MTWNIFELAHETKLFSIIIVILFIYLFYDHVSYEIMNYDVRILAMVDISEFERYFMWGEVLNKNY